MVAPAQSQSSGPKRMAALDVLRALAILLVLAAHIPHPNLPELRGHTCCAAWHRIGWTGVDLFFVLSGFLITSLLLKEREAQGRVDVRGFLIRRAFKIYPPLLVFLAALSVFLFCRYIHGTAESPSMMWKAIRPAFFHVQNFWAVTAAPHLWSLATEEHFYALVLVLVLIATRRSPEARTLPAFLLVVLTLAWTVRAVNVWGQVSLRGLGPAGETLRRIDALVAGALVGWSHCGVGGELTWRRRWWPVLVAGVALGWLPAAANPLSADNRLHATIAYPAVALGASCLLLISLRIGSWCATALPVSLSRVLRWPIEGIGFVGRSSYSTYLFHVPFVYAIFTTYPEVRWAGNRSLILVYWFVSFVAVALLFGALGYVLVEIPALWLRKRWFPDRRRLGTEAASPMKQAA